MAAKKRLTDADVRWIKRMYNGTRSMAKIASAVGCSRQHVSDILHGRRRRSVNGDAGT